MKNKNIKRKDSNTMQLNSCINSIFHTKYTWFLQKKKEKKKTAQVLCQKLLISFELKKESKDLKTLTL